MGTARHSRSSTVRHVSRRPSVVSSCTKSSLQTWLGDRARVGTVGHRARIVPLVHGSRAVRVAAHRGRGRPGELGRLQQGQEEDRELHGWKKDWQLRRVNEGRADLELTAGEGADGAVSPNSLRSSGFRGGVSSLKFAIRAIGEVPRLPRRTAGADVHRDRDGA